MPSLLIRRENWDFVNVKINYDSAEKYDSQDDSTGVKDGLRKDILAENNELPKVETNVLVKAKPAKVSEPVKDAVPARVAVPAKPRLSQPRRLSQQRRR